MAPISLMSIFPLRSLRACFQEHSGFLDAGFFELLKQEDFTPDAWTVLSMLRIPTAKDLIMRLGETNLDGGLSTHFSLTHREFKDYLTSRGFPLKANDIHPIVEKPKPSIGVVDCSQDTVHLISHNYFDFHLDMTSSTCESAPETLWHTKLTLEETSFNQKREFIMRAGDKATLTNGGITPPLQMEHLGFEGTQAHMRFHSNVMILKAPKV